MKKNQLIILGILIGILSIIYIVIYRSKINTINNVNTQNIEQACPIDFEEEVEPCE